jgi:hypothetical protein
MTRLGESGVVSQISTPVRPGLGAPYSYWLLCCSDSKLSSSSAESLIALAATFSARWSGHADHRRYLPGLGEMLRCDARQTEVADQPRIAQLSESAEMLAHRVHVLLTAQVDDVEAQDRDRHRLSRR